MDDERIVLWSALCLENVPNCLFIEGVSTEAIYGFGGKDNKLTTEDEPCAFFYCFCAAEDFGFFHNSVVYPQISAR